LKKDDEEPDDEEEDDDDEEDPIPAAIGLYNMGRDDNASIFGGGRNSMAIDDKLHQLAWEPKKIATEWKNKDGIRNLSLIIALTGGAANTDSNGVECKVTSDGTEFVISERWSSLMLQIDSFYEPLKDHRAHDESEDEFNRRKYAMEDQAQALMQQSGDAIVASVFKMSLPFQVDPTSLRTRFLGTRDGNRFCHIDLTEKQKFKAHTVMMMDSYPNHGPAPVGSSEKPRYSSIHHY
jgi:hypothetical protein